VGLVFLLIVVNPSMPPSLTQLLLLMFLLRDLLSPLRFAYARRLYTIWLFNAMYAASCCWSLDKCCPRCSSVNGWGFLRGQRQGDVSHNSYSHELFVRDNPELCLKMVRSGASKTAGGEAVSGVVKKRTKRKTKDDDAGKDDEEEVSKKAVDKEEQESPNPSSPSDQISVTEPSLPPSSAEEDDEGQVVQNELEEENFSVGHDGSDQEDDDGRSKKDKQEKVAISSSKDDILASRGLDGEEPSNPLSEDEILTNKKKKKRKKSSNKDIETDLPSRIQEGKRGSSVVNKTITESDDDNDRVGEEESGGSDDDSTSS